MSLSAAILHEIYVSRRAAPSLETWPGGERRRDVVHSCCLDGPSALDGFVWQSVPGGR